MQVQALPRARQGKAASADESLRDLQHGISTAPDGFKVLLRCAPAQGVQASGVDTVLKSPAQARGLVVASQFFAARVKPTATLAVHEIRWSTPQDLPAL
jgi:hypothetical protein